MAERRAPHQTLGLKVSNLHRYRLPSGADTGALKGSTLPGHLGKPYALPYCSIVTTVMIP